jgi:hypothetical protein
MKIFLQQKVLGKWHPVALSIEASARGFRYERQISQSAAVARPTITRYGVPKTGRCKALSCAARRPQQRMSAQCRAMSPAARDLTKPYREDQRVCLIRRESSATSRSPAVSATALAIIPGRDMLENEASDVGPVRAHPRSPRQATTQTMVLMVMTLAKACSTMEQA